MSAISQPEAKCESPSRDIVTGRKLYATTVDEKQYPAALCSASCDSPANLITCRHESMGGRSDDRRSDRSVLVRGRWPGRSGIAHPEGGPHLAAGGDHLPPRSAGARGA